MEIKKVRYFEAAGEANTKDCLNLVRNEVLDNGYKYIIVSSNTGKTGALFAEELNGMDINLIVVTHSDDPRGPKLDDTVRKMIIDNRATLFNGPSISSSIDMAYQKEGASEVALQTLRIMGEGLKICCECVMQVTNAALIHEGIEALVVAGSKGGADTVAVIRVFSTKRIKELRVLEVLAKPRGY